MPKRLTKNQNFATAIMQAHGAPKGLIYDFAPHPLRFRHPMWPDCPVGPKDKPRKRRKKRRNRH